MKVQNSVRLKYKFYKAILKVFSFWRGFSQSSELDSRYTPEAENSRDTPSHHLIYLVMWLWKILISQILMDSDVQMSRYFSKSHCPIVVMLQAPGEECHLDYSQELYLSNFGDYRSSRSEFLIYKFKLLSFLKRLYNMSSTTCIHDPLPITPWRHSLTQTWPIKHWEYLGMKL